MWPICCQEIPIFCQEIPIFYGQVHAILVSYLKKQMPTFGKEGETTTQWCDDPHFFLQERKRSCWKAWKKCLSISALSSGYRSQISRTSTRRGESWQSTEHESISQLTIWFQLWLHEVQQPGQEDDWRGLKDDRGRDSQSDEADARRGQRQGVQREYNDHRRHLWWC